MVWCLIQARSTSTRLPNKIMEKIGNKPMLQVVIENCQKVFENVCVVIPFDDPVKYWLYDFNHLFIEGSGVDVLDRYHKAAHMLGARHIVRITSDCPLIPRQELISARDWCECGGIGFYSNLPTVDGWDVEAFDICVLDMMHQEAKSAHEREHVTTYVKDNMKEIIDCYSTSYLPSYLPKLSVDTFEDLQRVRQFYV